MEHEKLGLQMVRLCLLVEVSETRLETVLELGLGSALVPVSDSLLGFQQEERWDTKSGIVLDSWWVHCSEKKLVYWLPGWWVLWLALLWPQIVSCCKARYRNTGGLKDKHCRVSPAWQSFAPEYFRLVNNRNKPPRPMSTHIQFCTNSPTLLECSGQSPLQHRKKDFGCNFDVPSSHYHPRQLEILGRPRRWCSRK